MSKFLLKRTIYAGMGVQLKYNEVKPVVTSTAKLKKLSLSEEQIDSLVELGALAEIEEEPVEVEPEKQAFSAPDANKKEPAKKTSKRKTAAQKRAEAKAAKEAEAQTVEEPTEEAEEG